MSREQWADFCIYAVRRGRNPRKIEKVRAYKDSGDDFKVFFEFSKCSVIMQIEKGARFCTILEDALGTYKKGADVIVFRRDYEWYLKIDSDEAASDDLGKLPVF